MTLYQKSYLLNIQLEMKWLIHNSPIRSEESLGKATNFFFILNGVQVDPQS